jgi:hypothetical protein
MEIEGRKKQPAGPGKDPPHNPSLAIQHLRFRRGKPEQHSRERYETEENGPSLPHPYPSTAVPRHVFSKKKQAQE